MALLPLVMMDNPVLHRKAKRVRSIDSSIQKLIDDMIETMHYIGGAAGLAAPQVGIPLQVVVIEMPGEEPLAIINPEIVKSSDETEVVEGCLSLPGYRGDIVRASNVTVKGRDRHGKEIRIKADGLKAQALQHEIDHVNGVVYIDHLKSMDDLYKVEDEEEEEAGGI
ncbi:MAG: peptide deformylase [Dehalococcoidia bacterium]|nr:peptide deformylase [Dehalococcoidia bacterium]